MAEIRLTVDEKFINGLKKDTGIDKASQLTNDALTLLKWAVSEVKKGRVLISTDEKGGDAKKIVMPTLEMAKISQINFMAHTEPHRQPPHTPQENNAANDEKNMVVNASAHLLESPDELPSIMVDVDENPNVQQPSLPIIGYHLAKFCILFFILFCGLFMAMLVIFLFFVKPFLMLLRL